MEKKPMTVPFIIYADIESLLDKIVTYHNNFEKSSAAKINKYSLAYIQLIIIYALLIWCHKNQAWLLQRQGLMKNFSRDLKSMQQK